MFRKNTQTERSELTHGVVPSQFIQELTDEQLGSVSGGGREPLGTTWGARYLSGGAFDSTTIKN